MKKYPKNLIYKVFLNRSSKSLAALFVVVATAVLLVSVSVAAVSIRMEAESGTLSSGASLISDATASGGSAIRFSSSSNPGGNTPIRTGLKCTLVLSGAGQNNDGQPDRSDSDGIGYTIITPAKPVDGSNPWRHTFWLYDGPHNNQHDPGSASDETDYVNLRNYINNYLTSRNCGPTMIEGSSNGGGFAAKLFCRGDDFGGRVWGYYVGDPVMDDGVLNCQPSPNIVKTMFTHSNELANQAAAAVSGNQCSWDPPYTATPRPGQGTGWYCENNRTRTIQTYQNETGRPTYLTGQGHGGYELAPTRAPWHVVPVWWCEWIRDYETTPLPAGCGWTGVTR